MIQEQASSGSILMRRSLSKRRSFRSRVDSDDRGWTLLHIGARKGDLKEVKRLLDKGMDVNVLAWGPKSKGVTPLHLAAEGGHIDVMDELLERVPTLMPELGVLAAGPHCMVQLKKGRK